MTRLMNAFNGEKWRILTPIIQSFLTILCTLMIFQLGDLRTSLRDIQGEVKTLANDYLHELGEIKERLGQIEGRNVILNGIGHTR